MVVWILNNQSLSQRLKRENFEVLWLFAKVFSAKFGGVASCGGTIGGTRQRVFFQLSTVLDEEDAFDWEEDDVEEEVKLPGKVGTKKLRRIQEKAERKAKREVREDGRGKEGEGSVLDDSNSSCSYRIPFSTPPPSHPHSKRRHYEKIRSAEKHWGRRRGNRKRRWRGCKGSKRSDRSCCLVFCSPFISIIISIQCEAFYDLNFGFRGTVNRLTPFWASGFHGTAYRLTPFWASGFHGTIYRLTPFWASGFHGTVYRLTPFWESGFHGTINRSTPFWESGFHGTVYRLTPFWASGNASDLGFLSRP